MLNDGYAYTLRVQRGGDTVLELLAREFRHSAPEVWAARLLAGEVELDGVVVRGPEPLRPGQTLVWHRPPWPEEAVPLHFAVLHEDADLLVVNKPSGLPTMPGGGFLKHTLLSLVRQRWPGASPLHRLGRGTSGAVLFSLNAAAGARVLEAWRTGGVRKTYRALASGVAQADTADIRTPIGKVAHPRLGDVYAATPDGKPSHSIARVLERRAHSTLFAVEIPTGRPHQIRIHLASIGHPLLDDPLYVAGGHARPDGLPGDLGYLLHARTLELTHPTGGERLRIEAPGPGVLDVGGAW